MPNLQKLACQVVSRTISQRACESNFSDFAYIVSEKRNKLEIEDNIFPNSPFAQDKIIIWELISSYSIGSQQLSNC